MTTKYSIRAIQQGQTLQNYLVTSDAGANGRALVIQAAQGTRYQIADILTLVSPAKLQIKRAGKNLLLALPGGDVGNPDVVVQNFFAVEDVSMSGFSGKGELMAYDTSFASGSGDTAGIHTQALGDSQIAIATLAAPGGLLGPDWYSSGWGLAALAGGGLAVAAMGRSSGSDSGSSSAAAAGLAKITAYKSDPSKATPAVADFQDAGVIGVDTSNLVGITTLIPRSQLTLNTAASLQTLVNSFNKILAEANGTAPDASPNLDPVATDYVNLMGANSPSFLGKKDGALSLLNDRVKALNATDLDTYSEIKALADAVEVVSQLAQAAASTTGAAASTGNLTQAQLALLGVDVTATNLGAVSDAIRQAPDDMSTLGTTAKLKDLVSAYNKILAEANGSAADATLANPSAQDYAAIQASIGLAATDSDALARLNAVLGNLSSDAVDTVDEINKLAATLDKVQTIAALATGASLNAAQTFTATELSALGLTGLGSSSEANNNALAIKVSEAIRDKELADVGPGLGTGQKLVDGVKTAANQTQVERLQALMGLEVIKNYTVDAVSPANTTAAPTLADWSNLGIFHVRSDGSGMADVLSATEVNYLNTAADKLPATQLDGVVKLQTMADTYFKIYAEANGIAADATPANPTASDYGLIGLGASSKAVAVASPQNAAALKLLNDVVGNRIGTEVDSVKEIQALSDTVDKVMRAASGVSQNFTVAELSALGLRGASSTATSANMVDFDQLLQATSSANGDAVDTVAELQALLSLAVLRAWARDVNADASASPAVVKTAIVPTAQDYKDIGVVRSVAKNAADGSAGAVPAQLSVADVAAVNDAMDTLVVNTNGVVNSETLLGDTGKVKAIAASYFKILNEANGSASNYISDALVHDATTDLNVDPTWQDYVKLGVTPAVEDANRTSLINSLVGEKTFAQVNTVAELQHLVSVADTLLGAAGNAAGANLTLAQLSNSTTDANNDGLGLVGVNSNNWLDINAAIHAVTGADKLNTFEELQSLVGFVRIARYASTSVNDVPTFADWASLKLDTGTDLVGENSQYLSSYNSAVDAFNTIGGVGSTSTDSTPGHLQGLVTAYNTILAEANGAAADATLADPTTLDYANIGLDLSSLWTGYAFTDVHGSGAAKGDIALQILNDAIGELNTSAVASLSQLTGLANTVKYLVDQASATNTATLQSDPLVNPSVAPTSNSTVPGNLAADLAALGLQNAAKLGDNSYRYNGSQYNYYEKENVWAALQNMDVGNHPNSPATPGTLLSYAEIQNIVNKYAF